MSERGIEGDPTGEEQARRFAAQQDAEVARLRQRREARQAAFVVAEGRSESEACECGTPGCCVDHMASPPRTGCETW